MKATQVGRTFLLCISSFAVDILVVTVSTLVNQIALLVPLVFSSLFLHKEELFLWDSILIFLLVYMFTENFFYGYKIKWIFY